MRILFFLVLLSFSFSSEKKNEKCYKSFQNWYQKNNDQLKQSYSKDDLTFEMSYLPNELTIFQQLYIKKDFSKEQIKSLYSKYNSYDEFRLKISTQDSRDLILSKSSDKEEYQEIQFYLIESIQQDFYMICNKDTLRPVQCQFENNYGTAPFITLHLAFEKAPKTKTNKLEIHYSDQLFQSDNIVFDFTHLKNLKIPKIK